MATKAKFYIATSSGWVEADFGGSGNGSFYGVCNTAAGTSAKTVTGVEDFTLETGRSINVKFTNAYTLTTTPTLNINNTGAKYMRRNGSTSSLNWAAGAIIQFVYDGTYWVMIDAAARDTDTNYYHTTGQWNGLTYTATANGGVGDLSFTLPTGTNSTTVSRGDHSHDGRYYTEAEVNNLLSGKSDTTHDHNTTYIRQDTEATATTIGGVCIKLSNGILYISTTPMES